MAIAEQSQDRVWTAPCRECRDRSCWLTGADAAAAAACDVTGSAAVSDLPPDEVGRLGRIVGLAVTVAGGSEVGGHREALVRLAPRLCFSKRHSRWCLTRSACTHLAVGGRRTFDLGRATLEHGDLGALLGVGTSGSIDEDARLIVVVKVGAGRRGRCGRSIADRSRPARRYKIAREVGLRMSSGDVAAKSRNGIEKRVDIRRRCRKGCTTLDEKSRTHARRVAVAFSSDVCYGAEAGA